MTFQARSIQSASYEDKGGLEGNGYLNQIEAVYRSVVCDGISKRLSLLT
jgi:hypothetical protein